MLETDHLEASLSRGFCGLGLMIGFAAGESSVLDFGIPCLTQD